ncbi:hypothetical protein EV421DRAFT_1740370 [Armillaria borealis]|uniref:Uncharacterized protein n=1 Tax=Armillaria borealis TaxID=47425 RepID=A0AA39J4T6_9AGAR|nr:hypothetical protein EV421DRAFT_1740370 [Armillaria borealis]
MLGFDERGVKVLVYAGANYWVCVWVGNERWTVGLEWSGQKEFVNQGLRDWEIDRKFAGKTCNVMGLTLLRLMERGFLPKEALALLQRWTAEQVIESLVKQRCVTHGYHSVPLHCFGTKMIRNLAGQWQTTRWFSYYPSISIYCVSLSPLWRATPASCHCQAKALLDDSHFTFADVADSSSWGPLDSAHIARELGAPSYRAKIGADGHEGCWEHTGGY